MPHPHGPGDGSVPSHKGSTPQAPSPGGKGIPVPFPPQLPYRFYMLFFFFPLKLHLSPSMGPEQQHPHLVTRLEHCLQAAASSSHGKMAIKMELDPLT